MRWIGIVTGLFILTGFTVFLWERQFLRSPDQPTIVLLEEGGSRLSFEKTRVEPDLVHAVMLPYEKPVHSLLVSCSHAAKDLLIRDEPWQSGRVFVEWLNEEGNALSTDTIFGMKGTDKRPRISQTVVRCRAGKGFPVIRFEHLGRSGRMEIEDMTVFPVQSRNWNGLFAAVLLCFWLLWLIFFVRSFSTAENWRCVTGAIGLLAMGWFLIVPGPWAHPRPFGTSFAVGQSDENNRLVPIDIRGKKEASSPETLGELPIQGSWLIQVRMLLRVLRPILHVLLFAVPAVGLAYLCGVRCSVVSLVFVTLLVEVSQAFFWFGADWIDLIDLLVDWGGIALALVLYIKVIERPGGGRFVQWLKGMAFPFSQTPEDTIKGSLQD